MIGRPRVKMCGMMRAEDIQYAGVLGVDAIGLIFYPESPRYLTVHQAQILLKNKPIFMDVVCVLVNPEVTLVHQLLETLPLQCLQFHGDESPSFCEQFEFPYIKAVPADSHERIQAAIQRYSSAQACLLETPALNVRGGSGQIFDWQLIPERAEKPIILAGGLTPDNVQAAIENRMISAVDVCSGIEKMPGIKDHHKMKAFVDRISRHSTSSRS